jgi:hypothetical protein
MPGDFQTVRRLWRGLASLHLLLLAHLGYYLLILDKGRSLSFKGLALGVVLLAAGTIGLAFGLTPDRLDRLRRWLKAGRWLLLGGGVVVLFGFGLEIRQEWIYAHIALMSAATLTLILYTLYGSSPYGPVRGWVAAVVVVVILITAVRIYGLSVYPSIHYHDEPWDLGWAYSYLKTDKLSDWVFLGGEGFEGKTYYYIPRFYIPYALWLKVVGVGLWEGRLFAFGLVMLTTLFGAWAARNLYGRAVGWFSAGALFCSAGLMVGARIRHDIGLALAITLSLWAFSEAAKRQRPALHLLAGMFMGWGMFAHYHASGLGAVLALALYGPRYVTRLRAKQYWPEKELWLYVLGGLIGAGMVAVVQIFPDFDGFLKSRGPRNPKNIAQFLKALRGHLGHIWLFSRLEFVLIVLGLGAAMWRRRQADWTLILFAVLAPCALAFMAKAATTAFDELIVPLMPIYGILVGAMFGAGLSRRPRPEVPFPTIMAAAFLLALAPQLGLTVDAPLRHVLAGKPVRPAPPPQVQWVLDNVDPPATVSGEIYHFFWLHEYRFATSRIVGHISRKEYARYGSDDAVWDAIGVDIFIFDPTVGTYGMLTPLKTSGYLDSRGYQVAATFKAGGKTITIYQRTKQ